MHICSVQKLKNNICPVPTSNYVYQKNFVNNCGGLEMVPHVNKWSLLDGAHKWQLTVIVTTSELS